MSISERTRLASFNLELEVNAAVWCSELLKQPLPSDNKKFLKKFCGSSFVLLAEIYENKRGYFMKFTKISNGTVKNLVLPCGWNRWGWKKFAHCLDNLVGSRSAQPQIRRTVRRKWEHIQKPPSNPGSSSIDSEPIWDRNYPKRSHLCRNWKFAVIVFRLSVFDRWSVIQNGIGTLLDWDLETSPLAADRAIVWCNNAEQHKTLVNLGECHLPTARVIFRPWDPKTQFQNPKIVCSHNWIGIEGLPLNMWNNHVFKVLGSSCGGLLDVDINTAEKTFLPHARLQFRGLEGGFIPQNLNIHCWGEEITLKLFAVNDRNLRFHDNGTSMRKYPETTDAATSEPKPNLNTQPIA